MRKPLCIDLFCGLGGWTEGFLAEGWDVIGFDIERHVYSQLCPMCKGTGFCNGIPDCLLCNRTGNIAQRYPAQLALQDVLTLHGRQFRDADCIVASPPCQEYSHMAMPFSVGRRKASWLRWDRDSPFGHKEEYIALRALFDACFRIQREACEAAGRYIPMVVENVKGAQPWVGRAKANFGSFYFWGDVAMVGGQVVAGSVPRFGHTVKAARRGGKVDGFNFHQFEKTGKSGGSFQTAAVKTMGHANIRDGHSRTRHLTNQRESDLANGTKQGRKAASAQIAKIPFPLSSYIARSFRPRALPETR